jgi:hypothetical protein
MNILQKETWIKEMQEHQDMDSLVQGQWFSNGKGCFFGCAMQTKEGALEKAAQAMGLPFWIVGLAEVIFEGLEREEALKFPVEFLKAIPVDTDLEIVKHKIAVLRLYDLPHQRDEITDVINILKRVIEGEEVTADEWSAAEAAVAWSSVEWLAADAERSAFWKVERDNLIKTLKELNK